MRPSWLVLQLADSAFPSGGFAHSGGLEALVHDGRARTRDGLAQVLHELAWQAGLGLLPFVMAAHRGEDLDAVTRACDAFLTSHVASRASHAQGRAWIDASARVFGLPAPKVSPVHFAPAFGVVAVALDVDGPTTGALFLHVTLRGALSAAVRLGAVGPFEAQAMQLALGPTMTKVLDACLSRQVHEATQPSPALELLAGTQDRLYSRLFQS